MNITSVALPAALGCLCPLAAQSNVVSPVGGFETVEAGSTNPNPWGVTDQLVRYLQIHEDLPSSPVVVRGLSWRRNAAPSSIAPFSANLEMTCSVPFTTAAAPSADFASNHNTRTSVRVVARRSVSFPGSTPTLVMPEPFTYRVPFDVPFTTSGRIVWETLIYSRSNLTQMDFDAVAAGSNNSNPSPSVLRYGVGCLATGRSVAMAVAGGANVNWPAGTAQMSFGVQNGPASAPAIAVVGFNNQTWSGVPLPLQLPGSAGGASGPCFVQNDIVLTFFGATNAAGAYFSPSLPFAVHGGLHGLTIHHHVWALDAAANSFGWVTSDGLARQLIAPYPTPAIAVVGVRGSHAATGTPASGGGLVTRFDF